MLVWVPRFELANQLIETMRVAQPLRDVSRWLITHDEIEKGLKEERKLPKDKRQRAMQFEEKDDRRGQSPL